MKVRRGVLESIAAQARDSLPHECCGILLAEAGDPPTISRALQADNAERAAPQQRYVLGHKAHLEAVNAEASGRARIAGYYHSHPQGDARPSARDLERAVPGVAYLIVGLRRHSTAYAAWRLEEDRLIPEPLEVDE